MNKNLVNNFEMAEEQRKGKIFFYFIATIIPIAILNIAYTAYMVLTQEREVALKFSQFLISDIVSLAAVVLIWILHRSYPRVSRHIFVIFVLVAITLPFPIHEINQIFVGLALPILLAAFLLKPQYSPVYLIGAGAAYLLKLWSENVLNLEIFFLPGLFILAIISMVAWVIARSLEKALEQAWVLNQELDQRVQERTQELAEALTREQALAIRNETILNSIADGILVFDTNQQVIVANPAANQFAGRNLQSIAKEDLFQTIDKDTRLALYKWLNGQSPTKEKHIHFEWHNRILSSNVAPVTLQGNGTGDVNIGYVMALRDYTREAQLERAKDQFLGMVSHELRTPITAIRGYVEILMALEADNLSEQSFKYLEVIDSSTKQLMTLANELIDLSRIETGEIDLYKEWTDLPTVVHQAVDVVSHEFNNRNLSLTIEIDDTIPQLKIDGRRILQVLLNLLSNAYKYTQVGGATLQVTQTEKMVQISVRDTGRGIKKEEHNKVFKRFFRSGDKSVQNEGGTGLGLSISKAFVKLHNGHLTFESEYGVGTIFTLTLPKNIRETLPKAEHSAFPNIVSDPV